MKVCSTPGCPELTASSRCPQHTRATDKARGSRQARGYTWTHDRLRAQWATRIRTHGAHCHAEHCLEPTRRINPGDPWDLGHTPDRQRWTGPEHRRCNRSAGGRNAHP